MQVKLLWRCNKIQEETLTGAINEHDNAKRGPLLVPKVQMIIMKWCKKGTPSGSKSAKDEHEMMQKGSLWRFQNCKRPSENQAWHLNNSKLTSTEQSKKRTFCGSKSAKEWMKYEYEPLGVLKGLQGSESNRSNKVQGAVSWAVKQGKDECKEEVKNKF